jgi:peroxiredoxin
MRPCAFAIVLTTLTLHAAGEVAVRTGPEVLDPALCGIGRVVEDLAFTDAGGGKGKLSEFASQKALVIVLTSADCPLSKKYAPSIAALHAEFKDKGVSLLLLNSAHDSKESIAASIDRNKFAMRYIVDADCSVAAGLNAQTTTEAFVLDPARRLIYRGCIDDQYGLATSMTRRATSISAPPLKRCCAAISRPSRPRRLRAANWRCCPRKQPRPRKRITRRSAAFCRRAALNAIAPAATRRFR